MTHQRKRPAGWEPRQAVSKADPASPEYLPNTAEAQRMRLLAALRAGPVTTLQARRELDVMHPAARVMELRALGVHILTSWTREPADCGSLHRIARYVLLSGGH